MKNKIILLTLPLLLNCLCAQLEIRDASYNQIEGYTESSYDIGKEKRIIYLGSEILLSSDDVESAEVSAFDGTHVINVVFTNHGAQKLRKITEERIRKPLGIIVNGELLSAPTIQNPLSKNVMIRGSYSKDEAEVIARGILDHIKAE